MTDRPNILWLTYEDTSPQFVSCYGLCPVVTTPTIDRLAATGVRFDRAIASGPVCSVSRSALITGVCPEAMGLGHHRSRYPIPQEIRGFPAWLREAGYYATNNAKTDYNVADQEGFITTAWDESSTRAHWRDRQAGQPFFSVFNFHDSHQSRTMTRPWRWYEEEVLAHLTDDERIDPAALAMPPFYRDDPEMRRYVSRVHNSVRLCDRRIGERLAELEADGLLNDTIVFCFADHGQGIPRGKFNAIGFGYRAAFVARFPERWAHLSPWGAGTVTDELVAFEDLAPTMLSLAGIAAPAHMTGRAIAGVHRAPEPPQIFAARNRHDDAPDCCRSAIDRRYVYTRTYFPHLPVCKYQRYADVSDILQAIRRDYAAERLDPVQAELVAPSRPREYLYDLVADPWEVVNLAADPAHRSALERLRAATAEHAHAVGDVMFLPERTMLARAGDETPYRRRHDPAYNPLAELMAAADLVGDPQAIGEQLALLGHSDPSVRYWAGVGLFAAHDQLGDRLAEVRARFDAETDPSVAIELAAALLGAGAAADDGDPAVACLCTHITGEDRFLAHQALVKLIYLPRVAPRFAGVVPCDDGRLRGMDPDFPRTEAARMFHHLYGGESIHYLDDLPYLDHPQQLGAQP